MENNNNTKMMAGPAQSGVSGNTSSAGSSELTLAQKARASARKTPRTTEWDEVEDFLATSPIVGYLQAAGDNLA